MTLPAFETPRLTLTPATAGDTGMLQRHWNDPDVRRYLFDDQPVTRERAAGVLDDAFARAGGQWGLWLVRERGGTEVVGMAGVLPTGVAARHAPYLEGTVEVLVSLAPAVWGRGYATEALEPLIHYAFADRGLDRLVAVVDVPNEASHRLMRRLGFTLTGETDGPHYRQRTYALPASRFPVQRVPG